MIKMFEGKKTYVGLIIALAGALGIFKYVSESDLTTTFNTLLEVAGLLFAAYGRYAVKPKK